MKRIPLEKIQNSEYSQSWMEKQFGYGTVEISSAGGSGTDLQFRAVPEAENIQKQINKLSKQLKQQDYEQPIQKERSSLETEELTTELRKTRENLEQITELLSEK